MSSTEVRDKLERAAKAAAALQQYYDNLQLETGELAFSEATESERLPVRRASSSKYKLSALALFLPLSDCTSAAALVIATLLTTICQDAKIAIDQHLTRKHTLLKGLMHSVKQVRQLIR